MLYFKGMSIDKVGYCKCPNIPTLLSHQRLKSGDIGIFVVTAESRLKMGSIITIIMMAKIMTI